MNEPKPGAWLEPAFELWSGVDQLVKLMSTAVLVTGAAISLLYVGAVLERRALKGRLTVVDGVDAVRKAAAMAEAPDGDRG